MKVINSAFLFLAAMLLIASVKSEMAQAAANPVCPPQGRFSLSVQAAGESEIEFDEASYYPDMINYDSVALFVKNGDSATKFEFITFDDKFLVQTRKFCDGTEGFTFYALINQLLIMQNPSDQKYHACIFDKDAEGDLVTTQLTFPPHISQATKFVPFYFYQDRFLMAGISNDNNQGHIVAFSFGPNVQTGEQVPGQPRGAKLVNSFDQLGGNGVFNYDSVTSTFKSMGMGGSWTEQNNNFPIEATDVIKIYNLNKGTFVITAMTSDFMGGLVYLVDLDVPGTNSPAQTVTLPDDSSSPFEIRADGIFNFVVIGQNYFYWANSDENGRLKSVQVTGDILTAQIVDIALSGDKAAIFYPDRVDYYRIFGQSQPQSSIELLISNSFSTSIQADGQYRFGLSCLCGGLKRFSCYSSTLNCLIIKSASQSCAIRSIPAVVV